LQSPLKQANLLAQSESIVHWGGIASGANNNNNNSIEKNWLVSALRNQQYIIHLYNDKNIKLFDILYYILKVQEVWGFPM